MHKELTAALWKLLGKPDDWFPLSFVHPRLFSLEDLERRCYGYVRKPETYNYRTFRPTKDGLFCDSIFGALVSEESDESTPLRAVDQALPQGDALVSPNPRRIRLGRVMFAEPVVHPWFLHKDASLLAHLSGFSEEQVKQLVACESCVVLESGTSGLRVGEILDRERHAEFQDHDGCLLRFGALGLFEWLRLQGLETPSILHELPVLPPALRPLMLVEGGEEESLSSHELNDLYRRVINRNNRLRRLKELNAPLIIINNEARMLQESVNTLFHNGCGQRELLATGRRPYLSLHEMMEDALDGRTMWAALQEINAYLSEEPDALEGELPARMFRVVRYLEAVAITLQ